MNGQQHLVLAGRLQAQVGVGLSGCWAEQLARERVILSHAQKRVARQVDHGPIIFCWAESSAMHNDKVSSVIFRSIYLVNFV